MVILEEATFEAFGYFPKDLSYGSHKLVINICSTCGKRRVTRRKNYNFICQSCCHKREHLSQKTIKRMADVRKGKKFPSCGRDMHGENNSMFNNHHSDETRAEMSKVRTKEKIKCCCLLCGKVFRAPPSGVKRGQHKYCSQKCAGKAKMGAKNPAWCGGTSFEPYCTKFNETYKQEIREKFSNKCFLCNKTSEQNGRALDVHHVNYNKNCGCDDTKCVCVPLCQSCHSKTNGDREFYQTLIMNMLKPVEA